MSNWRKDPSAVLDFAFKWAATEDADGDTIEPWLQTGETITDYTITVETGLDLDSDTETNGTITVWLSGGDAGESYTVACLIETNAGRIDERTKRVDVMER